ncbi:MAG: tRNA (N6-threonylcarbamoyladenosine(37)-N6)-methyltransferase TrmO [Desulfobacterium sp.]|nr:tRNA (N6-threonylcarbamoyladenosine(37)-N6)-methyltransferase TrmO [Desulfobacterium sp.]
MTFRPIGYVETQATTVPRHWSVSDEVGTLHIDHQYQEGLGNIRAGQKIVVFFWFNKSPGFEPGYLVQTPPKTGKRTGVFSTCSPKRPNPLGMSVVQVLDIEGCAIRVKGIDMLDGTPILDIKPHVEADPVRE